MLKYRRLTPAELETLEPQFVRFLVSNTVTAADWINIKKKEPQKAVQLVDIFSNAVFETTLNKVTYLKNKASKDLKIYHFEPDKIILMGLTAAADSPADFNNDEELLHLIQQAEGLSVYRAEKRYERDRLEEIFNMLENGALISDGTLFHLLEKMY